MLQHNIPSNEDHWVATFAKKLAIGEWIRVMGYTASIYPMDRDEQYGVFFKNKYACVRFASEWAPKRKILRKRTFKRFNNTLTF